MAPHVPCSRFKAEKSFRTEPCQGEILKQQLTPGANAGEHAQIVLDQLVELGRMRSGIWVHDADIADNAIDLGLLEGNCPEAGSGVGEKKERNNGAENTEDTHREKPEWGL